MQAETVVPEGYLTAVISNKLFIYLLDVDNDIPRLSVSASVTIDGDLQCTVTLNQSVVSARNYDDLVSGNLKQLSHLVDLLARLKAWTTNDRSRPLSVGLDNLPDDGCPEYQRLTFVIEQLKLLATTKFARHYTPQMTVMAYMVHASSAAAYNTLLDSGVLCLPSVSTLKKVTKRLDSETGLDNTAYLKLRTSRLTELQRAVVLIIDEIYVAKRLEYSGGEVMTLLGNVTVCVVAVSVDNAAVNRKFYVDFLCGGTLKTHIANTVTGQPLFLLFDPVHNLKNIYNNFQARKSFECPPLSNSLPDGCTASCHVFRHCAAVRIRVHHAA